MARCLGLKIKLGPQRSDRQFHEGVQPLEAHACGLDYFPQPRRIVTPIRKRRLAPARIAFSFASLFRSRGPSGAGLSALKFAGALESTFME
jgi:hypothetical protein